MSHFLCLATPPEISKPELKSAFDSSIFFTDASNFLIGNKTRGEKILWNANLLQIGSSSSSLVGKSGYKKTHSNDRTELLVAGLKALLENENCSRVYFVLHCFQGNIKTEEFSLKGEQKITVDDLPEILGRLEEDTRYVVNE